MSEKAPWHGVIVAAALPFKEDLSVDYDKFADHVRFLADNGCDGVAPNGSLGEYQNLSEQERAQVIKTAVEAAPDGFSVMAGVGAYGALQSLHWAEQAAEAGADCVMLLPPNTYRASREQVKHHYATVAQAGLPIVGYNNPIDTKVDLLPDLIAEIHEAGHMVGVKEFTGDPRRIYEIQELAPGIDIAEDFTESAKTLVLGEEASQDIAQRVGVRIRFRDSAGRSWERSIDGRLHERENNPADFEFQFEPPVSA